MNDPDTGAGIGPTRTIEITRQLDAPPALAFEAWTTAEHLRRWFCPGGWAVPVCTCDFRKGGRFDVCMRSPEGEDYWSRARFTEIVPSALIAFSSDISIGDGDPRYGTETVVTFRADGEGTRLDMRQDITLYEPASAWMVEAAEPGWRDAVDKLEILVTAMKGSGK